MIRFLSGTEEKPVPSTCFLRTRRSEFSRSGGQEAERRKSRLPLVVSEWSGGIRRGAADLFELGAYALDLRLDGMAYGIHLLAHLAHRSQRGGRLGGRSARFPLETAPTDVFGR